MLHKQTLIFVIVIIYFGEVFCHSEFSEGVSTDFISCQTNFSSTVLNKNINLECQVELIYTSGGTAQCINFTQSSLIVETSPSVLNISFKCLSNKPIFSHVQFEFGIPMKHFVKLKWQRLLTDYNDPLSYSYQVIVIPPSNAFNAIGVTSAKYTFFNLQYPKENIQVLWHFSEIYVEGNPDPVPTVSWLEDIGSTIVTDVEWRKLHANKEIVTIPCVTPNWKNLILICDNELYPDECSASGIPIDNITLQYDPLVGFLLNTTKHRTKGFYHCVYLDDDIRRQFFVLSDYENSTFSSEISYFGTANELIRPPFFHVDGPIILGRNSSTRYDLQCSSTRFDVIIFAENNYGEELELNVTYSERDKPVKTSIAKCTTPPNLEGHWYFYCSDRQSPFENEVNTWSIYFGEPSYLPYLELAYDEKHETLKCFTNNGFNNGGISWVWVEMRHVECENIMMCRALAKCLYNPQYGTFRVNCRKGYGTGTDCETETKANGSNETSPTVAAPCVSVRPFKKGLAFCMETASGRLFQDLYFLGFDNKLYVGDVHPPLNAIMKITAEKTETDPLWAIPAHYLVQCEAHSFYFEEEIQWMYIYSDGSSRIIPPENLINVEANMPAENNPRSNVKLYINDTTIVGITCSAPTLSIRDEASPTKWQNITIGIQCKDAIAPEIIKSSDSMKEIRIGDENQGPKCKVEGYPQPKIEWFRNGHLLNNSKEDVTKRSSGEYVVENFLLFPKYTQNDAGEYLCVATNMIGSHRSTFTVVTEKNENDGKAVIITVPIVALVILVGISTILFVSYRMKIQRVRREEMKQILEMLKGSKTKAYTRDESPNSESFNPLQFPYDKKYELKKHSFFIDYSKTLGSGEFCTVFQGKISNFENDVAFKTVNNADDLVQLKSLTSELKILMYIGSHYNIIELIGAYTQEIEKGILIVALELCGLGSLHSYLKTNKGRFLACPILNPDIRKLNTLPRGYVRAADPTFMNTHSIKTLLQWSAEIASAMEYLGTKKIIHSDLATRNVLLTVDFVAKITDFGLSRKLYTSGEYFKKGRDDPLPWRWLAIESLQNFSFSAESDIWAYGITLYEIFSFGEIPYPGIDSPADLKSQLLEKQIRNDKPKLASWNLYEVMMKCWHFNSERRPTFKALKHLFQNAIQSSNFDVDPKNLETNELIQSNETLDREVDL